MNSPIVNKRLIDERQIRYPEFMRIVHCVRTMNPLQAKRLTAFITRQDYEYWDFCEHLSRVLNHKIFPRDEECREAVKAYDDLCLRMLRDQIQFRKTGVYQTSDPIVAQKEVYDQPEFMRKYMIGLLLTQMLWPNHYRLFRFFQSYVSTDRASATYLEIGAGHGFFVADVMRRYPLFQAVICDVSQTSIDVCKDILHAFDIDFSRVTFLRKNFFECSSLEQQYDFITVGEVLEHVLDAQKFLQQVYRLVRPNGRVYISTCANCPAPDHIYHFHNVSEIRDLIRSCGFIIDNEIFFPAEDVAPELWEEQLVTVNYGAILKPKRRTANGPNELN